MENYLIAEIPLKNNYSFFEEKSLFLLFVFENFIEN